MSDAHADDHADDDRAAERNRMVDEQLLARGISDARVLAAMRRVPRHEFVPATDAPEAYADHPLPIGFGVTISQPYIVALMTQTLRISPTDRVLEVGTGSGYAAAILAELAGSVVTIEALAELVEDARARLAGWGERVEVVHGDGSLGHPDRAPYDAISVTAGARSIPRPLLDQLTVGGRLVMPVGGRTQDLVLATRSPHGIEREVVTQVRFVPLTGEHGA